MSKSLEKTLRNLIQTTLIENFIREALADVETKISNEDIKKQGEEAASKIARGRGSYTLDMLPMHVVKYTVELLADAYAQGDGSFVMPSGGSFEINKPNIENGITTLFFPNDTQEYKNFLGPKAWALGDEDVLDKLSGYLMSNVKQKNTIDRYNQLSGEEGVVPSRMKYLLTMYSKNPGTVKSFTEFIKHNLANAARGYYDGNSKTVSLDKPMGGDSGNSSFGSMVKSDDDGEVERGYENIPDDAGVSNTEFGTKLKSFAKNFLIQMARAGVNKNYLNFFALKALIVAYYPDRNTSAQRNQEMLKMHQSNTLNPRLKNYMDIRQAHVNKNPTGNSYFKEHGRHTYAAARRMVNTAESIAKQEGYPAEFGSYLIENLLGMPIKANAILMEIALNNTDKSPVEVMEHMKINRTRLIKMFQKIKMDESKLNAIIKKIDMDILDRIIKSDNPLQTMKQYKISKSIFKDILISNGRSEEEVENITNSLIAKSTGTSTLGGDGDGEDWNKEFMDMNDLSLNEDEQLLEEDMNDLNNSFPSSEDAMWVINNLK